MSFINDSFMLKNEPAKKLYAMVKDLPIIDYHCHLSPKQIAENYQFKNAFDLTLVFYKGVQIADGELTLAALNKKTTKDVKSTADGLKIKASMKVGDAEKLFDSQFGITVQIKDKTGKKLVPNEITIGQAARGEY